MDCTEGPQAKLTRAFGDKLAKIAKRPVRYVDERLTSKAARALLSPAELTRKKLGDNYMRTYEKTVQAEVTESLADPSHYSKGKRMIRFDAPDKPRNAHVVEDGNLITARFPGDTFTFSQRIIDYLENK